MEQTNSRASNYLPPRPASRMATTTQRRPSTSNGSGYTEAKSQYLQQALSERRGQTTPQPRSTPQRRPSTRGAAPFRDEWTAAGDAPIQRSQSAGPQRQRARRASESSRDAPKPRPGLTIKETNALIDKLQKENFDLKLRITLQDDRLKKLDRDVEESKERIDAAERLEERYSILEDKAAKLEQHVSDFEKQRDLAKSHNVELVAMNEELVKELEQRDAAVEEAATIIHEQEQRFMAMQGSAPSKPQPRRLEKHHDSDYYSAEPESPHTPAVNGKPRPGSSSGSSIQPADSDYYSATSYSSPASAAPAPKTPRPVSRRQKPVPAAKPEAQKRRPGGVVSVEAQQGQAQPYGDHIPLRVSSAKAAVRSSLALAQQTSSIASLESSPDSLTPRPSLRRSRRNQEAAVSSLRLQNQQEDSISHPLSDSPTLPRSHPRVPQATAPRYRVLGTPADDIARSSSEPPVQWNSSRPLHSLYMTGELNRPVTADARAAMDLRLRAPGEAPANATPSVLEFPAYANDYDDDGTTLTTPTTARPEIPRTRNSARRIPSLQYSDPNSRFSDPNGILPKDEFDDGLSTSPTETIPATIASRKERHSTGRSDLQSEYSYASSVTVGGSRKYPPWPPSEGILQRDFMFRP